MTRKTSKKPQLSAMEQLIAVALLGRELYGLQLARAIQTASNGERCLSANSLYPMLQRLEKDGLVRSREEHDSGPRKRFYKLTPQGASLIEETLTLYAKLQAMDVN